MGLRPYQQQAVDAVEKGWDEFRKQLLVLPTGCHAAGTPILMHDGSVKRVEDVVPGDRLMGPDSLPRTVLQLARGRQTMYRVFTDKTSPFVVNADHMLSLRESKSGRIENTPLQVFVRYASMRRKCQCLWRAFPGTADVELMSFDVMRLGEGDYYGFALDGDHLYLTGDYTVHHNTGKTICFAHLAAREASQDRHTLILAHRDELLQQARDKLEAATGLSSALEKADSRAYELFGDSLFATKPNVVVGSVQTLGNGRLTRWPKDAFDLVVVDECFPAGTLVDGIPIESLKVGDRVSSYNHAARKIEPRSVLRVFSRRPSSLVTVHLLNGKSVRCTDNHPFFTQRGYVSAVSLKYGDCIYEAKNVRNLRQGVCAAKLEHKNDAPVFAGMQRERPGAAQEGRDCVLQGMRHRSRLVWARLVQSLPGLRVLLQGMPRRSIVAGCVSNHGGDKQAVRIRTDEAQQSDETRIQPPEDGGDAACYGTQAVAPGRQRTIHRPADEIGRRPGLGDGSRHRDSRNAVVMSQSGCGQPGHENRGGSRRVQSPCVCGTIERRREGRCLARVGVDRIEVHQQTGDGTFGGLCPDGLVYNIEVGGNHNYFASGVLVHNCHHVLSDSYRRIIDHFETARLLGVTATPDRGDKKSLGAVFENIAFEYPMPVAIREQYLAPIRAKLLPLRIDLGAVRTTAGDYNAADLDAGIEPYLKRVAEEVARNAGQRKTLVFLPLVRTSEMFAALLREQGIRAEHVDGGSPDRADILARYARGDFQALCNSSLLLEGYDCPDIACIVCLRPTKVRSLYQQMIGRGTRIAPGKDDLLILDFLWQSTEHSLCVPATLFARSDEECRQMMDLVAQGGGGGGNGDVDLLDAQADAQKSREGSLARRLREQLRKKARMLDPIEYALSLHDDDLMEYEPAMPWHFLEVTDKQRASLQRFGFDPNMVTCRGHASAVLDRVFARSRLHLCTPKQAAVLQKYGYDASGLTLDEAKQLIDTIAANGWRRVV